MRPSLVPLIVLLALPAGPACSLKRMAVRSLADTLADSGDVFSSDDDPELIRDAVPFALKTYESLLQDLPEHQGLLLATCQGFTQYAFAFVQTDADLLDPVEFERILELQERAISLYLRGRDYCLRGLELRGLSTALTSDPERAVAAARVDDVPILYWTGASWGAALSLGLDRPELVADLPAVRALLERALALDEGYARGAIHEAMISLEAVPEIMGGSPARAREHFARAVALSEGSSPGPYVTLAASVSVPAQDRNEFMELLERALAIDPDEHPSTRVATLINQKRARYLLGHVDDLIVEDPVEDLDR
jgi:predicted anti-sigma-YlaC factor YlaD